MRESTVVASPVPTLYSCGGGGSSGVGATGWVGIGAGVTFWLGAGLTQSLGLATGLGGGAACFGAADIPIWPIFVISISTACFSWNRKESAPAWKRRKCSPRDRTSASPKR